MSGRFWSAHTTRRARCFFRQLHVSLSVPLARHATVTRRAPSAPTHVAFPPLQHIFKDACPILGWRCAFNDIPVRCKSPQAARAAGLHLCFNQHGVRFKLAGSESYRFIHAVRTRKLTTQQRG
ncbi:MAG: hypothetical protein SGPRY_014505, partial [Prymnesium sp.]